LNASKGKIQGTMRAVKRVSIGTECYPDAFYMKSTTNTMGIERGFPDLRHWYPVTIEYKDIY
jgi:hypothetical protein